MDKHLPVGRQPDYPSRAFDDPRSIISRLEIPEGVKILVFEAISEDNCEVVNLDNVNEFGSNYDP